MTKFTREEAINLLIESFPPQPLPEIMDNGFFFSSAPAFDWLSVRNKPWTDVCKNKAETFEGFRFIPNLIPEEYYFYYLPAAWVAVFDEPEFFETIHRSLLPVHSHKLDQRWKKFISALSLKKIDTLIMFLEKCQSSVTEYEDVMEVNILKEALGKIK